MVNSQAPVGQVEYLAGIDARGAEARDARLERNAERRTLEAQVVPAAPLPDEVDGGPVRELRVVEVVDPGRQWNGWRPRPAVVGRGDGPGGDRVVDQPLHDHEEHAIARADQQRGSPANRSAIRTGVHGPAEPAGTRQTKTGLLNDVRVTPADVQRPRPVGDRDRFVAARFSALGPHDARPSENRCRGSPRL